MSKNTVRLYCCGGAGFNIANHILRSDIPQSDYLANLAFTMVDTSYSNFNRNKDVFTKANIEPVLIPDVDGAGGLRNEIAPKVQPYISKIVFNSNPADLNIVIHSASGGSGSIIAPLIVRNLIENGHNAMVIMVGDTTSNKFATNTSATIRTYESISRAIGKPIVCRYYQNHLSDSLTIDKINSNISGFISDFRMLFCGNIHGIDSQDLKNFFDFYKTTSSRSTLTLISTYAVPMESSNDELRKNLDNALGVDKYYIVAMANIVPYDNAKHQVVQCDYRIEGSIEQNNTGSSITNNEIYYVMTDNYFFHALKEIDGVIDEYNKQAHSRSAMQIDIGKPADENGLVF